MEENKYMTEKAIVWIKDDFRLKNNPALSYASNNHALISVVYVYNKKKFDNVREAQKWWISRSLDNYKIDLNNYNIDLEIVNSDEYTFFLLYRKYLGTNPLLMYEV